jgi:hypothetical protein
MITITTDIFGNSTASQNLTATQLSLFSASDTIALSEARSMQLPTSEIEDRIVAALIGQKLLSEQGLCFKTALTPRELSIGLTNLKLSGRVTISVSRKKIQEELYSLA